MVEDIYPQVAYNRFAQPVGDISLIILGDGLDNQLRDHQLHHNYKPAVIIGQYVVIQRFLNQYRLHKGNPR